MSAFMLRRTILLALLLSLLACNAKPPVAFQNTDITGADFGRALNLTDHHGKPRTLADFQGKAVVIFFGYTTCPDVCPTALAKFAGVLKQLDQEAARVQVLFVTIDPARDNEAQLAAYVSWFHPSFIGLYGDTAATAAAAREFKVFYARKETSGGLAYVLDHTAGAYIFDPAGRIRLYVKDDAPIAAIASDLHDLLGGR
jgi:protein SCO1/2